VVDLELSDLFVLVGGDSYERRLVKRVCVECVPSHTEDVVRLDNVDPRLVLVHRIQNDLYIDTKIHYHNTAIIASIFCRYFSRNICLWMLTCYALVG